MIYNLCVLLLILLTGTIPAQAPEFRGFVPTAQIKRHALLLGNLNYPQNKSLSNPSNDVQAMARVLTGLGFSVTHKIDLGKEAMESVISNFAKSLGKDDVALFYFSGHGFHAQGQDYILPAFPPYLNLRDEAQVIRSAISLESIFSRIGKDSSPNATTIFILDACRNNLWPQEDGLSANLSKTAIDTGKSIIYATGPGQLASDGHVMDSNGLFTYHLLKHIATPDLEIDEIVRRTSKGVSEESNYNQQVISSSTRQQSFYFNPTTPPDPRNQPVITDKLPIIPSSFPEPIETETCHLHVCFDRPAWFDDLLQKKLDLIKAEMVKRANITFKYKDMETLKDNDYEDIESWLETKAKTTFSYLKSSQNNNYELVFSLTKGKGILIQLFYNQKQPVLVTEQTLWMTTCQVTNFGEIFNIGEIQGALKFRKRFNIEIKDSMLMELQCGGQPDRITLIWTLVKKSRGKHPSRTDQIKESKVFYDQETVIPSIVDRSGKVDRFALDLSSPGLGVLTYYYLVETNDKLFTIGARDDPFRIMIENAP